MAKLKVSLKYMQVDKANSAVVASLALASFVVVFAGFVANALLTQQSYQKRVIEKKELSLDKMTVNLENAQSLRSSYDVFVSSPQNIIGGSSDGDGEKDGDNARIVLDALPSRYDFPALVTSVEKILSGHNVEINEISGTDQELSQGAEKDAGSDDTRGSKGLIEMPFSVRVSGDYAAVQGLISGYERSVRPFHVNSLTLSGDGDAMQLELLTKTYFQPEKVFQIKSEVVR